MQPGFGNFFSFSFNASAGFTSANPHIHARHVALPFSVVVRPKRFPFFLQGFGCHQINSRLFFLFGNVSRCWLMMDDLGNLSA